MKYRKYALLGLIVVGISLSAFIYSKSKDRTIVVEKSNLESLTNVLLELRESPNFQLALKVGQIDKRVASTKEKLNSDYYREFYEENVLIYRFAEYYVDDETKIFFDLYYDDLGKLIFADITHYRGAAYTMYFENDELLYVNVGPFSTDSNIYAKGGIKEVNEAIAKDNHYSYILEDIDLCLNYAYNNETLEEKQENVYGQNTNSLYNDDLSNPYFFGDNVEYVEYGSYITPMTNEDDVYYYEGDVTLKINHLERFEKGNLYTLEILQPEFKYPDDVIGEGNQYLGYFYVTPDEIYLRYASEDGYTDEENQAVIDYLTKNEENLGEEFNLVCVNENVDKLNDDRCHKIEVNGDQITFRNYSEYEGGTRFYQRIAWEKNKGIIHYRAGRGAQLFHTEFGIDIENQKNS